MWFFHVTILFVLKTTQYYVLHVWILYYTVLRSFNDSVLILRVRVSKWASLFLVVSLLTVHPFYILPVNCLSVGLVIASLGLIFICACALWCLPNSTFQVSGICMGSLSLIRSFFLVFGCLFFFFKRLYQSAV